MSLNLHQILATSDIKTKIIDMPSWGEGGVKIKAMSIQDQINYEQLASTTTDMLVLGMYLIKTSCVTDDGELIFSDTDIEALKKTKSSDSVARLIKEILALNFQKEDSVEQLEKN